MVAKAIGRPVNLRRRGRPRHAGIEPEDTNFFHPGFACLV